MSRTTRRHAHQRNPGTGIKRALKLTSFVFGFAQLEALFCGVGKIESETKCLDGWRLLIVSILRQVGYH